MVAIGAVVLALTSAAARADSVHDGRGVFGGVRILGLDDDQLRFRTPDGRVLSRRAPDVKRLAVNADADPLAAAMTEAEAHWERQRFGDALPLYRQVRRGAKADWLKTFAAMRLANAHDRLGEFESALDLYLEIAQDHPRLSRAVVPRRLPVRDTDEARSALVKIEAAERRSQPPDVAQTLRDLRDRIERGEGEARPRGPADDDEPQESGRRRPSTRAGSKAAESDAMQERIRKAIADNDLNLAASLFETGSKNARKADRAEWLVIEAELEYARKAYRKAGLAAMRVVAADPDGPQAPAALYQTGRVYEALGRPEKAAALYQECLQHTRTPADVRAAAEARLSALQFATPQP